MQSLTTLPDTKDFPNGESDQAWFNEASRKKSRQRRKEPSGMGPESQRAGWLVLFMMALFLGGLAYGGFFDRLRSHISGPIETYFLNAGITLKKIVIKGQVGLKDEQILDALGIHSGQSLFGFNAFDAQKQLTKLGQVKTARIMRLLPSTLLVEIEERHPFAIWLRDGRMDLVDKDGVVLRVLSKDQKTNYPLIIGVGAAKKAAHLIRILSTHEELAGRIKMAERVGQYRWNLHAKSGAMIKLPSTELALGLARFVELPGWRKLLDSKNLTVDLRHPGQAFVNEGSLSPSQSSSRF